MSLSLLRRPHGWLQAVTVFCLTALLAACGGGGMTSSTGTGSTGTPTGMSCGASSCGSAVMTLTDAKGDFLSYIVSLTSVQLQTANGTAVETLPAATKIDFAQLVDLTEVLSAGQIPAAAYVSAKLTLDYTNASITADDGTGKAVTLKPVDANGNTLTGTVTVTVQLDNTNHLVITAGNTGRLAFDFNLAASNTVNLTAGTVTVNPTLVATVVPSDMKQIRVRGSLVSTAAAQNDFVLKVQPFHHQTTTMGQMTVQVSATTTYQINGSALVGSAGLTALAGLQAGTMVAAFGTLTTTATAQTFTATSVLAGTSLQNTAQDQLTGTVIARTGNALTVRGATWSKRDGDFDFMIQDVTVKVGANTVVTEEGQTGTFTIANISVGQRIDAFGIASTATGPVTLDATAGEVRLDLTPAWGVVTALSTGSATLNLQSLGGLPVSVFNFAGTGTSTASDAKPTAYVVNTGTVPQTGLAVNSPAKVIGFVTPFGMAPPNFTARTLVNFAQVTDDLVVDWGTAGSPTALTGVTAASTSLQLNLTNVGNIHVIKIGPELVDLTKLATAPMIVPNTMATKDVFTIGHAGKFKTDNFNTFSAFVTQLATDLTSTTTVIAVAATGTYDTAANKFTANRIVVLLNN